MNPFKKLSLVTIILGASIAPLAATTLTEDFEGSFPSWESGWLGTNSNLQNVYGVGADRGNNPDGLWIDDGQNLGYGTTVINFGSVFGQSLSSLSFDIATWVNLTVEIFDSAGATLGSWSMAPNNGGYTDPGTYQNFTATSSNGIGGFRFFSNDEIEGNTSIDNVNVNTGGQSVPDSTSTAVLLGLGAVALASFRRRSAA